MTIRACGAVTAAIFTHLHSKAELTPEYFEGVVSWLSYSHFSNQSSHVIFNLYNFLPSHMSIRLLFVGIL